MKKNKMKESSLVIKRDHDKLIKILETVQLLKKGATLNRKCFCFEELEERNSFIVRI